MKILFPLDDSTEISGICPSFGRAPYFLVHDTETKENSLVKNTAADSQGGAGIKAAQLAADTGASAVLSPRCGQNSAEVLKAAGIRIYRTSGSSVKDNIAAYANGSLEEMTTFHSGFHGHGGK